MFVRRLRGLGLCAAFLAVFCAPARSQPSETKKPDVKSVVRRHWIEGLPDQVAAEYKSEADIKTLTQMLEDPKESTYWGNVVMILGSSHDPQVLKTLESFVTSGEGPVSQSVSNAKTSAVQLIGDQASQKSKPEVEGFLQKLRDVRWIRRNIRWWPQLPEMSKEEAESIRDSDLIREAALALESQPGYKMASKK